ncbi:MAG TPA: Holliday junction resolvase RuvX [Syntrophales bacterium]|nr:Holliday junction resolvase RuvX [Syntrophales bacterium]HPQ43440.1 Holliday junction resolvase RuvX [Syntrophales bacterium]
MRILGLDYGERRIGVAVCDELGMTARGVATITRTYWKKDIQQIERLVQEYEVEKIVIGYPVRLDGTEGIACEKVNMFGDALERGVSVPVVKWNESLSTKEAEGLLRETDMNHRKRRAVVDKVAASIILQDYLDHMKNKKDDRGAMD